MIEKTQEEVLHTVLSNILHMLANRHLIQHEEKKDIFDKITQNIDDINYEFDINKFITVKIIKEKISTIKRYGNIEDYFFKNRTRHKIIIIKDLNQKLYKQITEFSKTEVFREDEMMINVVDHKLQPFKFELLNSEDKDKVLEEYNVKSRQMPKINEFDIITRYYNAKVGDIFRIVRKSPIGVLDVIYRIVKPSSLEDLFKK